MDFISGLPITTMGYDTIWIIVDRLMTSTHFNAIKANYKLEKLALVYIIEIMRLHIVPSSIISNRDLRFTLKL